MFTFLKTHKLEVDIAMALAIILASIIFWTDFFNGEKWRWFEGIIITLMAVIKIVDVIEDLQKRRISPRNRGN